MGVVHLAQRPGGPRVALKVLRPHIVGDDEARRRLAREVGSLSRIRHPGVAEIVDADPWDDIPYVATRYVPGLSLHDHVREEGPITGPDLVWFATRLGEALLAVHAQGVLHRDVKPSNVLMEGRTPILIDFGLARVADDPKLTHTGWLLGTPGYLAPEILFGDDATAASDVHAWAATVAFAGTGQPPFGRGPAMAIMDRVRRGEHDLSGLPPHVRQVVVAGLDAEPQRRPSLPDLLRRLERPPAPASPKADRSFEDDFFTTPLAVASAARADDLTRADPTWDRRLGRPAGRADAGRADPPRPGRWVGDPRWAPAAGPPKQPFPVRARAAALLGAGGSRGRHGRRRLPLSGDLLARRPGLAAAQRLAGGVRGQQPADGARPDQVVRRPAAAPRHPVAPRAVDRGHAHARAVGSRPGHRGRPARLRLRAGALLDPGALRPHLHGRPVAGPGRPAGARAGTPRRRPDVAAPRGLVDRDRGAARRGLVRGVLVDTRGPDWAPADDHLLAGFSLDELLPGLR